jgi:hypothetical protein
MFHPTLSIIIVNYNTGHLVQECLESIKTNIKIGYQIFVVDNNSSDNSWEITKNTSNCVLIKNVNNNGFCAANNQILKIIKSNFILLLNPDTRLTPGAVDKMIEYMKANPMVGIMGPKVLYPNKKLQYTAFSFPNIWTILFDIIFLNKLFPKNKIFNKKFSGRWDCNDIKKVDAVSGCCLLLRKELYDDIGGLDENLFFMDDIDFCRRAINNNWDVIYFPQSIIYHHGGMSSKGNRYAPAYFGRISKIKYFCKYQNKKEVFLLKATLFIEIILRIPVDYIYHLFYKNTESKTRLKAYFDVLNFIFKKHKK